MSDSSVKVSDLIVEELERQGVTCVFLLSGGMMMHLLDSLSRSGKISYVCTHHEQAAAMAAEGFARQQPGLGVCYATSGPGATNTITGIAGAWLDSSPVLFLTGQSRSTLTARGIGRPELRMVGNFEVDIVSLARPITKYCEFVDDPRKSLFHLRKAIHLAKTGRPGPVLLDFPLDIQGSSVLRAELQEFLPAAAPAIPFPLDAVAAKIRATKRPLVLAGHGVRVSGAAEAFRSFVERFQVPVVLTQLASDLLPYRHPLYVGKAGLRGDRAGNFAIQHSDLLLALGSSLHVTTTGYEPGDFAPRAEKIVVDLDRAALEFDPVKAALKIPASVPEALAAFATLADGAFQADRAWLARCQAWKARFRVADEPHPVEGDEINPYRMIEALGDALRGGETIVTDAGSLYYIVGQAFQPKAGQRVIVSGALGSMGYALPAALGAAFAAPARKIVCVTGDGSLQMNVQELATLAYHKPNLLVIVVNNAGYASIRNSQTAFCDGNIAGASRQTGVGLPEWKGIAEAYGVPFASVSRASGLAGALARAVEAEGPLLLEIVTPEAVKMIPAVTSVKLPNGSFRSSRLHEMSPLLTPERLAEAGIDLE